MGNVISFSSSNDAVKPFTRPATNQHDVSASSSLICCKKRRVRPANSDNPTLHKKVDLNEINRHLAAPALLLVNIGSATELSNNNSRPIDQHPNLNETDPTLECNSAHNIAMSLQREETLLQDDSIAAEKKIKSHCVRIWDLEDIEGDNLSQDNENHCGNVQDFNVLETIKTSKEIVHVIISDDEEEDSPAKDKDTCINGVERPIILKRDDYLEIESLTSEDSVDVYSMSEDSFDVEASNEESPEDEDTISLNNEQKGVVGREQTLKKQLKKLDTNAKHLADNCDEIIAVPVYGKDSQNKNDVEMPQLLSERMEFSNFNTREEELFTAQYEINQENTDIMIIDLEEDENDENSETTKVRLSRVIINKYMIVNIIILLSFQFSSIRRKLTLLMGQRRIIQ